MPAAAAALLCGSSPRPYDRRFGAKRAPKCRGGAQRIYFAAPRRPTHPPAHDAIIIVVAGERHACMCSSINMALFFVSLVNIWHHPLRPQRALRDGRGGHAWNNVVGVSWRATTTRSAMRSARELCCTHPDLLRRLPVLRVVPGHLLLLLLLLLLHRLPDAIMRTPAPRRALRAPRLAAG